MTNDMHTQNDGTTDETASAHEIEESIASYDATREAPGDTAEFGRQSPPSFAPHDDDDGDGEGRKSERANHRDGDDHPDHEDRSELRRSAKRRRRLPWLTIVVGVLVLCAAFGYLYANGNISGTPRAQAMSSCQTQAAKATEAKRLADMAISSTKAYIDDPKTQIDTDDLRRLNVLMDDAGKEPAIPACTITTRDNDLKAHAKTAKELHDVYITIAKELLAITGGTIDGLVASDSSDATTPQPTATVTEEPTPTPSATGAPSASATPTPDETATSSPEPSTSDSSTSSPSASATPTASPSPSPDSSATRRSAATQSGTQSGTTGRDAAPSTDR